MTSPRERQGSEVHGCGEVNLCLAGDVMLGRGIDQILPYPSEPELHEGYVKSAEGYVRLAEQVNGAIARPVDWRYVWGDALAELERRRPDAWMVNLETAITTSNDWEDKGINYRMNPQNIPAITAARVDCCLLANNHVLDWGEAGLLQTLRTLVEAGVKTAGAGRNLKEAAAPALLPAGSGRVLVFAFASPSSGIPPHWAATDQGAGVNFLPRLDEKAVAGFGAEVRNHKTAGDIAIASLHWGPNWGYEIPRLYSEFAHGLIDEAGIDVVFGHSSHHPKAIEVYRQKLILYGSGDFIDDYEGISGYEAFRDDLVLMYFASLDPQDGKLKRLSMVPLQIRNFHLKRASPADARWLCDVLHRESSRFGASVELHSESDLRLRW